jgi:IS30 family transposase
MEQVKNTTKARKWQQITERERYKIEGYFEAGLCAKEIGRKLGKSKRTIERERKLGMVEQKRLNPSNSKSPEQELYVVEWVYKADAAQRVHKERAEGKGRGLKIGHDHALSAYLEKKIGEEKWSPDAAIGAIKAQGLQFQESVCTKTVYNYIDAGIFIGISNKDLWVKKGGKKRGYKHIRKVALNNRNGKSIEERPECVNERKEAGHWEIDLVVGKQGTKPVILTLVERKTRQSIYVLVKNKTQKEVIAAVRRARRRVGGNFDDVFKSITADNGSEFLDSDGIKKAAKCGEVYYAHPYSSWERGSSENGNRILRRFVPKGTDIGKLTAKQLQKIEDWVNNYPRKILNYKTAKELAAA